MTIRGLIIIFIQHKRQIYPKIFKFQILEFNKFGQTYEINSLLSPLSYLGNIYSTLWVVFYKKNN